MSIWCFIWYTTYHERTKQSTPWLSISTLERQGTNDNLNNTESDSLGFIHHIPEELIPSIWWGFTYAAVLLLIVSCCTGCGCYVVLSAYVRECRHLLVYILTASHTCGFFLDQLRDKLDIHPQINTREQKSALLMLIRHLFFLRS